MSKYFYPAIAGIEMHILNVYAPFTKKWNVKVFTSKDTFEEKNVLPKLSKRHNVDIQRGNRLTFGIIDSLFAPEKSVISIQNSNIVPQGLILLLLSLRKVIGKRNVKLVFVPHGGFNPNWINFSILGKRIKIFIHYVLLSKLINYICDGVIAISEWERKELINKGINPKIIKVIINGIESEAFDLNESSLSKKTIKLRATLGNYVVQVARVNRIKNIETTIKALQYFQDKSLKLLIIGPVEDKQYKNELDELIRGLSLTKRVLFAGPVAGREKFFLIRHAKAMVHMAIWESFCNSIYEGMSQGKVIIASNNTAIPYLVKPYKTGYLVNTYDHISLAKKLNYILSDKGKKIKMKIEAYNKFISKESTWEVTSKKTLDYFERLHI